MANTLLIQNAQAVNEGAVAPLDVFVKDDVIHTIGPNLRLAADHAIDARGLYLLPGVIDDQVHFREPGLTHKADLYTESRAAAAGGITSFMEMPNTKPPALTQKLLAEKYEAAAKRSLVNYSFFMGASNDNLEEIMKTDGKNVCGLKIFMGSSTGNMLVDDEAVLEKIFRETDLLIATHCEDEATVRANMEAARERWGEDVPMREHPNIRSEAACYLSSSKAVALAKMHDARLHVLHISTAKETELFGNELPLAHKRITAEACIHHLWFNDQDYAEKGAHIKWNPAVKTEADRAGVFQAVLDNRIDIIATDHAPHTLEEKANKYFSAPSGGPMVQHALPVMLEFYHEGKITLERVVEKMCHAPAICFRLEKRGFIREGYFADLVLVDLDSPWTVAKDNILYKCGWSPLEGQKLRARIANTFVNGKMVYRDGKMIETDAAMRLTFDRN